MKESFIRTWINFWYAFGDDKFLAYIIVGVVVLGGLGIWLPGLVPSGSWSDLAIPSNHLTYSFAILITLCIEGLLVYEKTHDENNFGLGLIFGTFAIGFSLLGYSKDIPELSVLGTILAIIIHAAATANSKRFKNKPKENIPSSSSVGYKEPSADNLNKKGGK